MHGQQASNEAILFTTHPQHVETTTPRYNTAHDALHANQGVVVGTYNFIAVAGAWLDVDVNIVRDVHRAVPAALVTQPLRYLTLALTTIATASRYTCTHTERTVDNTNSLHKLTQQAHA